MTLEEWVKKDIDRHCRIDISNTGIYNLDLYDKYKSVRVSGSKWFTGFQDIIYVKSNNLQEMIDKSLEKWKELYE